MIVQYYRRFLELNIGIPFTDGNRIAVLQNGDEIFPSMIQNIDRAGQSIDFLTYVYWQGEIAVRFADALAKRASVGVSVRVLLDSYGAMSMPSHCLDLMEQAGVEVRWFRPLGTFRAWRVDKRTHRKILIIDDRVGFTGGVGIADEWAGNARNKNEWRDSHFMLEGPSLAGLKGAFLDNWNEAGAWEASNPGEGFTNDLADDGRPHAAAGVPIQIVRANSTVGWTETAGLIRALVSMAQTSLIIATPYFVPDPKLSDLLCDAAERGVDVRILLPGKYCGSRLSQLAGYPSIERLLDAGVRLYRYEQTLLHAKLLIVDGVVNGIGSANLNHRSMGKDEECSAIVLCSELAEQLTAAFESDLMHATAFDLDEWKSRSWTLRFREWLARLIIEQL